MIDRRTFNQALGASVFVAASPALIGRAQTNVPKIGFVYLGPVGDYGWTYQHDVGRKELVAHFGNKISTTFVENVPETADAERVIADLAVIMDSEGAPLACCSRRMSKGGMPYFRREVVGTSSHSPENS